ncbi:hypothetical protein B0H34DRAFT_679114 [Crassisporium funariophilum]|nr:hypothetical protein B0H34DRAFT_679114 [Crassisporium funariophilum]
MPSVLAGGSEGILIREPHDLKRRQGVILGHDVHDNGLAMMLTDADNARKPSSLVDQIPPKDIDVALRSSPKIVQRDTYHYQTMLLGLSILARDIPWVSFAVEKAHPHPARRPRMETSSTTESGKFTPSDFQKKRGSSTTSSPTAQIVRVTNSALLDITASCLCDIQEFSVSYAENSLNQLLENLGGLPNSKTLALRSSSIIVPQPSNVFGVVLLFLIAYIRRKGVY